ncbi:hypothetical protein L6452_20867 [Arctium lappa]|uniref:Uncharacterized protein n=1 Tax=Arctium lappa TaxID=4217 RepID=A0ACB9BCJ5_ARCLA|nr:hypothetical protein L6452_20867 [Arctium lappa]
METFSLLAVNNEITGRLKEFTTEEMKGSDTKLVIQKILHAHDLARNQNRLSMPMNQLETQEFLTADEKRYLENGGELTNNSEDLIKENTKVEVQVWSFRRDRQLCFALACMETETETMVDCNLLAIMRDAWRI